MNLLLDLNYAWRLLRKSWAYSLLCAGVVALSVGLAIFTYSLAYSQMLKPLGYPNSEHWYSVQVAAAAGATAEPHVDAYTYQELLKHNRSADYLGAFAIRAVVLGEGQASTRLRAAAVSPRLLGATKVPPLLGRIFEEADGLSGAAPVAILSFDSWQNYFAGNPAIIGKTARIDSGPVQIVGVMPPGFLAFKDFELWLPLQMQPIARPSDSTMIVSPLILLGKDQSLKSILNEMAPVVNGVNSDYPEVYNTARHLALIPAARMFTHAETPVVVMVSLIAAAVFVLGCVNISIVFLARLLERSRELALRAAIGASRSGLLRQCLLETVLVVLVGLVLGYGLAVVGIRWAQGIGDFATRVLAGGHLPNLVVLRPTDLLVAVIAATAIWLLSTLIPAWRVTKQDAAVVLAGTGKGASVRVSSKTVSILVGVQVLVSCLVLVASGSMVLALKQELGKPSGIKTSHIIISTFPTVFDGRFSEPTRRLHYWEDLTAGIKSRMPGADVAFTTTVPTKPAKVAASIEVQQGTAQQGSLTLPLSVVSDNYFQLLGVTLRSGRLFDSTDNSSSLKVAIIDEQLVTRYWPNQEVLGKRVQLTPSQSGPWLTIVGVVSAVAGRPYGTDIGAIYEPLRQAVPMEFQVLVKVPNDASNSRSEIRAAAFSVDRDLPLHNLQTLDEDLEALNIGYTALMPLFTVIAFITALLAASGLFGLISRSVAQRTQEVGIRRALGATKWGATSMFARQGALYLAVATAGVGLGIALVPPLSKAIPNILERVAPVTLGVILLWAILIFSASYLPTRRAVALEPGDALRYE